FVLGAETRTIPITVVQRAKARTVSALSPHTGEKLRSLTGNPIRAGDQAWGIGVQVSGTVGWNFVLNGKVVCLSCCHILCANVTSTPTGSDVFLRGVLEATLFTYQPLDVNANTWDYALALYNDPTDALAELKPCADGSVYPYPQALSAA